jgi:hypothetical protein
MYAVATQRYVWAVLPVTVTLREPFVVSAVTVGSFVAVIDPTLVIVVLATPPLGIVVVAADASR